MTASRQFIESPWIQGVEEEIAYQVNTAAWGSSPTNVSVKLYRTSRGERVDVSELLVGAASVSGDVITLPRVTGLQPLETYRLEVKFSGGGNVFEAYGYIRGEE